MKITHEIVIKHLEQRTSQAEDEMLDRWLESSLSNRELFKEIKAVWDNSVLWERRQDFDVSTAWEKIQNRIDDSPTVTVKLWERQWFKIAAVFVIVLGLALIGGKYERQQSVSENLSMIEVSAQTAPEAVILPDGSVVSLMVGSSISYLEDFSDQRSVYLEGGAHFDVTEGKFDFVVKAENTTVTVLGTEFLVNNLGEDVLVYVEEGRVAVQNQFVSSIPNLGHDQAISIDESTGRMKRIDHVANLTAWKTGQLKFDNVVLSQVVDDIEQHYNVTMNLENSDLGNCHLTSKFDNKSLGEVFKVLELVLNIEIIETDTKEYIISGKGC